MTRERTSVREERGKQPASSTSQATTADESSRASELETIQAKQSTIRSAESICKPFHRTGQPNDSFWLIRSFPFSRRTLRVTSPNAHLLRSAGTVNVEPDQFVVVVVFIDRGRIWRCRSEQDDDDAHRRNRRAVSREQQKQRQQQRHRLLLLAPSSAHQLLAAAAAAARRRGQHDDKGTIPGRRRPDRKLRRR